MPLTIATWNINSVRLRLPLALRFLADQAPDVFCLQEIKCTEDQFPAAAFAELGYTHQILRGEKAYNGVAIVSRRPLEAIEPFDMCGQGDARHVAARVDDRVTLHNFYVPAGGDTPDPVANEKFDHKLRFVEEMAARLHEEQRQSVLVGDLNIAPFENDVWSHKQMLKVVSHTPEEVERLERLRAAGGWIDAARRFTPLDQKLFSWWSYRARDWAASDRGRRLDHVWVSSDLAEALTGSTTMREARGWEKPSDHVPVVATLAL